MALCSRSEPVRISINHPAAAALFRHGGLTQEQAELVASKLVAAGLDIVRTSDFMTPESTLITLEMLMEKSDEESVERFDDEAWRHLGELIADSRTLAALKAKLQLYANPASNPGAHELSRACLRLIDDLQPVPPAD